MNVVPLRQEVPLCPCCEQPLAGVQVNRMRIALFDSGVMDKRMRPHVRRLLIALADAGGRLSRHEYLISRIWNDSDDAPQWANTAVKLYVHDARKIIGPHLKIECIWGEGYRLANV